MICKPVLSAIVLSAMNQEQSPAFGGQGIISGKGNSTVPPLVWKTAGPAGPGAGVYTSGVFKNPGSRVFLTTF